MHELPTMDATMKNSLMDVNQDFDYRDIISGILDESDADFQLLLGEDPSSGSINGIGTSFSNGQDMFNFDPQMQMNHQFNERLTSDGINVGDGSPYSVVYDSPNGSYGSMDSGIRSADFSSSSPDSPLTPLEGSQSLSFPNLTESINDVHIPSLQLPQNSNINQNFNLSSNQNMNTTTQSYNATTSSINTNQNLNTLLTTPQNLQLPPVNLDIKNQNELILKHLQDQLTLYQELNKEKMKEQIEKQHQQQQQHQQLLQNQILLYLQQQKLLQDRNVPVPQSGVNVPKLNQDGSADLSGTLSGAKDNSQIRKILLITKNNIIDKTKNKIQDTFQETKSKLNKLPKPNKAFGKRKLPSPSTGSGVKLNKTQPQSMLEQLGNLPTNLSTSTQGSTVASLLLQPPGNTSNILRADQNSLNNLSIPIAPVSKSHLNNNNIEHSGDHKSLSKVRRKTRVEHVVIEKRYRMKITESLNELKRMLNCHSEKKSTKNGILQEAIIEINKLRRENHSLKKKVTKMKKLFEELRNIGIIPESQSVSVSSSSESDVSEPINEQNLLEIEPEINQDHHVSPLLRQSARDGAKVLTCFAMFLFWIITPFSWLSIDSTSRNGAYQSRHLLSVLDQDASPGSFFATNVINCFLSVMFLMFMLIHGNPKCEKNEKLTLGFNGQLKKAQKKINKCEYDDAKGYLRISLFIVGNSCPKTLYGQWASFLWKCMRHMLYQLGILTALESVGNAVLPSSLSGPSKKEQREFSGYLSFQAYKKLHEVALKDPSSTYLEAACYLMNAVQAAESSGDPELICTAYTTAVIHMRDRVRFISYILQYYFTSCAHHLSLASKDNRTYAVDWIFESRGYDFFANDKWNIRKHAAFDVVQTESETDIDEADLLQTVYAQYQDDLLTKALRRIVVPETYYPNEGKIEWNQRAISFLDKLCTGPASEQLDGVSLHYQSVYGWWKLVLKSMLHFAEEKNIDPSDLHMQEDLYEDIDESNRSRLIVVTHSVLNAYFGVVDLQNKCKMLSARGILMESDHLRWKILAASQLLNEMTNAAGDISDNEDIKEMITILSCNVIIKSSYLLWNIAKPNIGLTDQELNLLIKHKEVLQHFTFNFPELASVIEELDFEIQLISGACHQELNRALKRSKHVKLAQHQNNELNGYYNNQNYPLKQDGFIREQDSFIR